VNSTRYPAETMGRKVVPLADERTSQAVYRGGDPGDNATGRRRERHPAPAPRANMK
jgi:hypothetical protein